MAVTVNTSTAGVLNTSLTYILAQNSGPVILPSSGTSDAIGNITLTTALAYQPSGAVLIYLPAGVVTAGSQGTGAKLYSVIFSSTTVCQLTGTGIVTANAAYTQDTTAVTLVSVTVPGGAMGANGALRPWARFTHPSNANTKTYTFLHAGLSVTSSSPTTSAGGNLQGSIHNRGSQTAQVSGTSFANATGVGTNYRTVDTSVSQIVTITGQLSVATDYIVLEAYTIEVLPLS